MSIIQNKSRHQQTLVHRLTLLSMKPASIIRASENRTTEKILFIYFLHKIVDFYGYLEVNPLATGKNPEKQIIITGWVSFSYTKCGKKSQLSKPTSSTN